MGISAETKAAIISAYVGGETSVSLGRRFGVNAAYVRTLYQRSPVNGRKEYASRVTGGRIVDLAKRGMTVKEISQGTGYSTATIYNHLRRNGVVPLKKRGASAGAPWIPERVRQAYVAAAEKRGVSTRKLAQEVLVQSASLIDAILDDA